MSHMDIHNDTAILLRPENGDVSSITDRKTACQDSSSRKQGRPSNSASVNECAGQEIDILRFLG